MTWVVCQRAFINQFESVDIFYHFVYPCIRLLGVLNISIILLCLGSQENTYMCLMMDTFEFWGVCGSCPLTVCVTEVRNDDAGPLVNDGDEKQGRAKD